MMWAFESVVTERRGEIRVEILLAGVWVWDETFDVSPEAYRRYDAEFFTWDGDPDTEPERLPDSADGAQRQAIRHFAGALAKAVKR